MFRSSCARAFLLVGSMPLTVSAQADTANKSNNPLNLAPGADLQGHYAPSLFDTNVHTNGLLLRGTLPITDS